SAGPTVREKEGSRSYCREKEGKTAGPGTGREKEGSRFLLPGERRGALLSGEGGQFVAVPYCREKEGSRSYCREKEGSRSYCREKEGSRSYCREKEGSRSYCREKEGSRSYCREKEGSRPYCREKEGSTSYCAIRIYQSINQSNVFIKPFLHQPMSQSAVQKPSLKPQTAKGAVERERVENSRSGTGSTSGEQIRVPLPQAE
uniref:Uncharacterized protein n=1 Tax=Oncorhynchus tshawytscha TaxID=74940 RepID=A0AAZ3PN34_ONCTS